MEKIIDKQLDEIVEQLSGSIISEIKNKLIKNVKDNCDTYADVKEFLKRNKMLCGVQM